MIPGVAKAKVTAGEAKVTAGEARVVDGAARAMVGVARAVANGEANGERASTAASSLITSELSWLAKSDYTAYSLDLSVYCMVHVYA